MKQKAILFSDQMVRAILEDRKSVTRRVIKSSDALALINNPNVSSINPYGQVGDLLWVRETWKIGAWCNDGRMAIDYKASPELTNTPWIKLPRDLFEKLAKQSWDQCIKANSKVLNSDGLFVWEPGKSPCKWRPCIFMPKQAARIWLEITSVTAERLHDITSASAEREGIEIRMSEADEEFRDYMAKGRNDSYWGETYYTAPVPSFISLWESINGIGSWDDNPWVWVVEFKRISKPELS